MHIIYKRNLVRPRNHHIATYLLSSINQTITMFFTAFVVEKLKKY